MEMDLQEPDQRIEESNWGCICVLLVYKSGNFQGPSREHIGWSEVIIPDFKWAFVGGEVMVSSESWICGCDIQENIKTRPIYAFMTQSPHKVLRSFGELNVDQI
jgi:hypothetical protein